VKHYSSGMYLRLGFAVAVNVDPDILLVDEVLTVGDEGFQRQCIARIREFQREGRTVVIVTHAPDLVRQLCNRAIVLDHGRVVLDGDPRDAIRAFRAHLYLGRALVDSDESTATRTAAVVSDQDAWITEVHVDHPGVAEGRRLKPHEPLAIRVGYQTRVPVSGALFGVAIHDATGTLVYGANTRMLDVFVPPLDGPGRVEFAFGDVPLHDGTYYVSLAIQSLDESVVYDWHDQEYSFEVASIDKLQGLVALPLAVDVRVVPTPSVP
jgi:ABC-2 type transport system ATP-binding protein